MKTLLYPPIERLRSELLDTPVPKCYHEIPDLDPAWTDAETPAMPDFLCERIARMVAAQTAYSPSAPAVGQIRAITAVNAQNERNSRPLGRALGVLLGAHLDAQRWHGWLVTADTDYATDRDLLIEEEDGPADPQAGMILTRMPLRIRLTGNEPILAKLSPARLGAVIALAEAPLGAETIPARPGHIFARDLDAAHVGITGSPLGNDADPRHAYRVLHRQLAEEITAAADAVASPSDPEAKRGIFPGWLFGTRWAPAPVLGLLLALLTAQSLWLSALREENLIYRGSKTAVAAPCRDVPRLRVIFKAAAPQEAIVLLLRKAEAHIVSGPSETGELWLGLPSNAAIDETSSQFRNSPLVSEIMILDQREPGCTP